MSKTGKLYWRRWCTVEMSGALVPRASGAAVGILAPRPCHGQRSLKVVYNQVA
jgi:hypothetical protein